MRDWLGRLFLRWERWVLRVTGHPCPGCGAFIPQGLEDDHECE